MDLKALFVDAAGTLLKLREPVGVTYARIAREHGVVVEPWQVQDRFKAAMRRGGRQEGDGRAFWGRVVAESIGTDDPAIREALYQWYATTRAWWVDTEALQALAPLARQGVLLGIVSNWDTRLRTLYHRYALDRMFPVLVCSAEVELEKPDPAIFVLACEVAGVRPGEAVHIGDDAEKDAWGASRAGLVGIHYDEEAGWRDIAERLRRLRGPAFGRFPG